jgi:hypothetical protein
VKIRRRNGMEINIDEIDVMGLAVDEEWGDE